MSTTYSNTLTLRRDDRCDVQFKVVRDSDDGVSQCRLNGMAVHRLLDDNTEGAMLALLSLDSFEDLAHWSFDEDASGRIVFDDMQTPLRRVEFTQATRDDYDLKLVAISPKGKRTCVLLLNHTQVGALQRWLERSRIASHPNQI